MTMDSQEAPGSGERREYRVRVETGGQENLWKISGPDLSVLGVMEALMRVEEYAGLIAGCDSLTIARPE
jgi:hypothetical protein